MNKVLAHITCLWSAKVFTPNLNLFGTIQPDQVPVQKSKEQQTLAVYDAH